MTKIKTPLEFLVENLQIRLVWKKQEACHSLHSYFNTCPESPDGRLILLFTSDRHDSLYGDLWLLERENGKTTLLKNNIEVEDAHRQTNQQWVCDGEYVVYMELNNNVWQVVRQDIQTMKSEVLCENRQVGWGQPGLDIVPLYGPHWNPGHHRDLELLNIKTGKIETILTVDELLIEYGDFIRDLFEGSINDLSIFFPILSPDGQRIFFKLSVPDDRQFRSDNASRRNGMVIYDCKEKRILGVRKGWGHPSWHPESRHILSKSFMIDTDTMNETTVPNYPEEFNSHAVISPDSQLLAMDIANGDLSGKPGHWTIVLSDMNGNFSRIHTSPAAGHGSTCWRQTHPHPIFNEQSNRLYFNVNEGEWTRLYLAEFR